MSHTTARVDADCLFCSIIAESTPAEVVAQNAFAIAIRDISPQAPTHVLVIPRDHIEDASAVNERDGAILAGMIGLANEVATTEGVARNGFRLVFNVGDDAGNTVAHLHLHLLGGRPLEWPPG